MQLAQHCAPGGAPVRAEGRAGVVTVALAGPPNVGKSTIFNRLTGLSQHVGNWTGKTVEQRVGTCRHAGHMVDVVDLPGAYSLSASSPEEEVAREHLLRERPDVVVAVVSAAQLERTLYLVAELAELALPLVVAVNMLDVARGEGIVVDVDALSRLLGCPTVPVVAASGLGVTALLDAAIAAASAPTQALASRPRLGPHIEALRGQLRLLLTGADLGPYPADWVALKVLEGDRRLTTLAWSALSAPDSATLAVILGNAEDAPIHVAGARYEWVADVAAGAQLRPGGPRVSMTARVDRLAANLYAGPVLLLALLGAAFWLIFQVSTPIVDLLDTLTTGLGDQVRLGVGGWSPLLADFLTAGVIGGVGTVLSLVPILALFYLVMAILEDVGYMARAAYVVDSLMHRIGLHGKSFLPLFLGFGCNVPAVLGTRILESERARLLTVLLTPFVPCSGRMIVVMFVSGAVFGPLGPAVALGLLLLNVAVLIGTGLVASRVIFREPSPPFVMEMPLYHVPSWRGVALVTWQRVVAFVTRAGTVILIVSMTVWAFATFPGGTLETSALAWVGQQLAPAGALMGLDWRMVVALLSSFVAKENALATLAVLTASDEGTLATALPALLSPASAAAFLVAQMLFVPCVATVTTLKQETGSWRLAAGSALYHTALSFALGAATYQALAALGLGGH